jgi:peptidoglycan/xylan/chitin deacetylase (PgdA/CDA1 family)
MWRDKAKAIVERGFVSSGIPSLSRLGHRRGVLVLAYHNVVPPGIAVGGESSLHLGEDSFAAQLDLLQQTHDIVSLEELLKGGPASRHRPRAVLTFDDAYRGAVTAGVRHIVSRALPATIFVPPAFLGGRFFWWDDVTQPRARGSAEAFRTFALERCAGADEAVRRWAAASGYETRTLPEVAACASIDELRAASDKPGITLASHTWSHPNLARLPPSQLHDELARPLAWLRERFDRVLPVLSYPYGLASPKVERAAASVGYRAAVLVTGGWAPPRPCNLFALPRWSVPPGVSLDGFFLRTAGLFCR